MIEQAALLSSCLYLLNGFYEILVPGILQPWNNSAVYERQGLDYKIAAGLHQTALKKMLHLNI